MTAGDVSQANLPMMHPDPGSGPQDSWLANTHAVHAGAATLPEAVCRAADSGAVLLFAKGDQKPVELPWRRLREHAWTAAQRLLHLGLRRGGRVVIMLPTGEAWLGAFFGTLLAGGVPVPVGPTFSFGGIEKYVRTVRHIAVDACAQIFVGSEHAQAHLSTLREDNPALEHFVRAEELSSAPFDRRPLPSVEPHELAVLQYTSGTTSLPKGVMLSHRALLANSYMIGSRVGMRSADVGISWLPLFHDMGLVGALMTALYWQYPLLLMPVESFLMHPRRWLQYISRLRATLAVAPNFAYQTAVDRISARHADGLDLSSWRCAFNGSEMVRAGTLRAFATRFRAQGFREHALLPVYGMAENTLAATFPPRDTPWRAFRAEREALERRRAVPAPTGNGAAEIVAVGTPLAGTEVAVLDERGRKQPVGALGEIVVKSPSLMDGYFGNEADTARVLREGWLHTGDLGFVHDGQLFITGRAKELIIKRGRNYYPEELEGAAVEAAGDGLVRGAAAFGCPDQQSGTETVVLVLETKSLSPEQREALEKAINGALIGAFGIRADVTLYVPQRTIPRTTSGKVRRTALRTQYLHGDLSQIIS